VAHPDTQSAWRRGLRPYVGSNPSIDDAARLAARWLRSDARMAGRHLIRNTLAGSAFTPRLLRWYLYRLSGLAIDTPNIADHCVIRVSELSVGTGTYIGPRCYFEGLGPITIGDDCLFGPGSTLLTSHHAIDPGDGSFERLPEPRPVVVGDRVWVGAGCILAPGAVVEDDCVIGAGAVVIGRCAGGRTYGGVPARPLPASQEGARAPGPRRRGVHEARVGDRSR